MSKGTYPHAIGENSSHYLHGKCKTRLYRIWTNIKTRCLNPRATRFKTWGGRGVTICDEWKNDFKAFYDWAITHGYQDNLTIDRIDSNGNYKPSNCRWATPREQASHLAHTRLIEFNGETYPLSGWARKIGISRQTLQMRLNKYGWSVEKALTTKKGKVHAGK